MSEASRLRKALRRFVDKDVELVVQERGQSLTVSPVMFGTLGFTHDEQGLTLRGPDEHVAGMLRINWVEVHTVEDKPPGEKDFVGFQAGHFRVTVGLPD
jgi:hypothetical protein